jgi:hypothetical protein
MWPPVVAGRSVNGHEHVSHPDPGDTKQQIQKARSAAERP